MNIQKTAGGLAGFAAAAIVGLSVATATTAQADPAESLVGPGCSAYASQVPDGSRFGHRNGAGPGRGRGVE